MGMITKTLQIHDIKLHVLEENKHDASWYLQRKTFEERHSLLYPLLQREGFSTFVDVGANYGFISMLARKAMPDARIISLEADPRLAGLISQNFKLNGMDLPEVLNVVAGDKDGELSTFCLNPNSSLDNRVTFDGWKEIQVPTRSVGSLLETRSITGPVFIKIDTQGYETKVITGLERWLSTRNDWLIKMEFAPKWLESQGHDPLDLLAYLAQRFDFVEYPERLPYNTPNLISLLERPITKHQLPQFLQYVVSLNQNGLGWVDLLVRQKSL